MRTREETEELRRRILEDERLTLPSATVVENAPLALIQLELETRLEVLDWILGERDEAAGSAS